MFNFLDNLNNIEILFLSIGFIGQGFLHQDLYSNGYILKENESSIPLIFWYLSIFGGIGLLTYQFSEKIQLLYLGNYLDY